MRRQRTLEGSDYIKIVYDDGHTYGMSLPTLRYRLFADQRATLDHEIADARSLLEAAGIVSELAVELSVSDPARDAVLAFVLRERVTNVVRHSDGSICYVCVGESADDRPGAGTGNVEWDGE